MAPLGSSATIQFHIADPGDVIDGTVSTLYGGTQPFSISGGGAIFATTPVSFVSAGQYLAAFRVNVPATGSVFYYSMNPGVAVGRK